MTTVFYLVMSANMIGIGYCLGRWHATKVTIDVIDELTREMKR